MSVAEIVFKDGISAPDLNVFYAKSHKSLESRSSA